MFVVLKIHTRLRIQDWRFGLDNGVTPMMAKNDKHIGTVYLIVRTWKLYVYSHDSSLAPSPSFMIAVYPPQLRLTISEIPPSSAPALESGKGLVIGKSQRHSFQLRFAFKTDQFKIMCKC